MPSENPDIRHIEEARLAELLNWALDESDATQSPSDEASRHPTPAPEGSPRMPDPK